MWTALLAQLVAGDWIALLGIVAGFVVGAVTTGFGMLFKAGNWTAKVDGLIDKIDLHDKHNKERHDEVCKRLDQGQIEFKELRSIYDEQRGRVDELREVFVRVLDKPLGRYLRNEDPK